MTFTNCYGDDARAAAYAELEIANTYYLAFRDLPDIITSHVVGSQALDFGCGAGRSTRFLRRLGFSACGVDISPAMIARAKEVEPREDFRLIRDGDFSSLAPQSFDLITAIFTFDNIAASRRSICMSGRPSPRLPSRKTATRSPATWCASSRRTAQTNVPSKTFFVRTPATAGFFSGPNCAWRRRTTRWRPMRNRIGG
jgi:SAM-dependent methyltransferase